MYKTTKDTKGTKFKEQIGNSILRVPRALRGRYLLLVAGKHALRRAGSGRLGIHRNRQSFLSSVFLRVLCGLDSFCE